MKVRLYDGFGFKTVLSWTPKGFYPNINVYRLKGKKDFSKKCTDNIEK